MLGVVGSNLTTVMDVYAFILFVSSVKVERPSDWLIPPPVQGDLQTVYSIKELEKCGHGPTRGGCRANDKKKLHGLSPRANYTDRATAACLRSDCQLLRIESATWSRQEPLLFYQVRSSSAVLTRLSRPRSRPTTFFSGSAGNRTRASGSVAKNSHH
jgi:hypothetical protein